MTTKPWRHFYRKAVIFLNPFKQQVDLWTRRYPAITAVLFALLGLALIWIVNRGAI